MQYKLNVPKLELEEVYDLHPEADSLVIIPIHQPTVQESSGENGMKILVVTGGGGSEHIMDQFPLRFGKVHAVGQDVTQYQEGDLVYFHRFAGQDGDTIGGTILQIKKHEIMGKASIKYKEI